MGAGFELGFYGRDIPPVKQTSPKLLLQISVSGMCMQYGPAGDVIAAGDSDGRIHLDQLALLTYPATRTFILARG